MSASTTRSALLVCGVVLLVVAVALFRERGRSAATTADPAVAPTGLPRLLDLGSDKCIPCKQMAPILAELKAEYAGKARIDFVDVWEDPAAGEPFDVRVIPTQVFFDREGREVWRHEGFLSKADIVAKLKELGAG